MPRTSYKCDCRRCHYYDHQQLRSEGEPQTNTCDKDPVPECEHYCTLRKGFIDQDVIPYLKRNWATNYEKVWDTGTKTHGVPLVDTEGNPVLDEDGNPVLDELSIWYEEQRDWLLPVVRFEVVLRALMDRASYCEFYLIKRFQTN